MISTFIWYFYHQHLADTEPAIGTLFHTMLNMVNLFFTKEFSSEDYSDSRFEIWNIPQGDDVFFFKNLWLNLT